MAACAAVLKVLALSAVLSTLPKPTMALSTAAQAAIAGCNGRLRSGAQGFGAVGRVVNTA